ncbi:DUF2793 domain-containing protein [Sphingomonas sp. CLY1604]|uniref:DUF2793 domain-containing protein n=1 Tax=Sphingomonas sp. CLY1604 TaxID=3457786 RepID=UPI003FD80E22
MTDDTTARFGLPLLAAGQAGKELTHNEALARLELLVQPAVVALGVNLPPEVPRIGECWVVGTDPGGAWAGHANALAGWTAGGWRFAAPVEGLGGWCVSSAKPIAYHNGLWQEGDVSCARVVIGGQPVVGSRAAAIADPAGGGVVDDAARTTLAAILSAMRQHGLIAR